ncbi:MAG: DNA mismatch repair endonuclease MutL [Bacillota bacterium]
MMKRIQVLNPLLANQIAAGEVIERPASVVKELVENAIDAQSSSIVVQIKGGGIDFIRITDNGTGILESDVAVAFERHATSKIAQVEDLTHIETLGFRGEALSSIAAVAEVRLQSRTADSESGVLLELDGGDQKKLTPCGCPVGTTIEVSRLFYNVPARLKFLKSQRTEAAYIADYLSRMILAHPEISFRLINQDKTVLDSAGDGSLKTAIFCVYGKDAIPELRELEYDDGYVRITGYIGGEGYGCSNRQKQSFFVNGRYIKSTKLGYALERSYVERLMVGKYPFAAMAIQISSNEIDVNVHPNKLEIRFKNEERIVSAVTQSARRALGDWVAPKAALPPRLTAPDMGIVSTRSNTAKPMNISQMTDVFRPYDRKNESIAFRPNAEPAKAFEGGVSLREPATSYDIKQLRTDAFSRAAEPMGADIAHPEKKEQTALDVRQSAIVGNVFDTYWIVQQGDSVFLIDQHAAHERLLYDRFMQKVGVHSQHLLIPQTVRLTAAEFETWFENRERFSELGYEMEEFGSYTVCIRAVPSVLGEPQTERFLHDAIDALQHSRSAATPELKRETIIQSACKAAVKAGNVLSHSEIEALLDGFSKTGVALTCPHGRPVMIRLTKRDFEKMFKRVL